MNENAIASIVWRYGVGCLETRRQEKTLSEGDYLRALNFVHTGEVPPESFVRLCFPKPFQHASTLEEMETYWHETHRSADEHTPVYRAKLYKEQRVIGERPGKAWRAFIDRPPKDIYPSTFAVNWHRYELRVGSTVYLHNMVIAEVIEY